MKPLIVDHNDGHNNKRDNEHVPDYGHGGEPNDKNSNIKTNNTKLIMIGNKIAMVRKLLNCTQVVFAEAIGITPQTLSLIERGNFQLTNNLAAKIYFSLYELISNQQTIKELNLEEYKVIAIEDLLGLLREYIYQINSGFAEKIKNHGLKTEKLYTK